MSKFIGFNIGVAVLLLLAGTTIPYIILIVGVMYLIGSTL
jgi:hypothetical protein